MIFKQMSQAVAVPIRYRYIIDNKIRMINVHVITFKTIVQKYGYNFDMDGATNYSCRSNSSGFDPQNG